MRAKTVTIDWRKLYVKMVILWEEIESTALAIWKIAKATIFTDEYLKRENWE